jgi:integrase/recombinase XerD
VPVTREQFERFCQERKYVYNVSHNTLRLYQTAWKKWEKFGPDSVGFIAGMRESGSSPSGCNIHVRALNAFFRWAGEKALPKLKAEEKIPETFTASDIQKLLRFKPHKRNARTYLLALLLLDTGLRISEALSLRIADVDLDNMLLSVKGKGGKSRLVPFSFEMRKHLWKHSTRQGYELLFASKTGNMLMHRNTLRAVKALCITAGAKPPSRLLHSFRHTFAVNYLRNGGSVFHLQKALGHSTLDMSRRYANLLTEDLQQMQQRVSLLNRMR